MKNRVLLPLLALLPAAALAAAPLTRPTPVHAAAFDSACATVIAAKHSRFAPPSAASSGSESLPSADSSDPADDWPLLSSSIARKSKPEGFFSSTAEANILQT